MAVCRALLDPAAAYRVSSQAARDWGRSTTKREQQMTDTIDLLEQLGRNPSWRHASTAELQRALAGARIDARVRDALLGDDTRQLGALLGAEPNVCCLIVKPD